mmetsp:Transcript_2293/g.4732  ORF Transcript_2293/g.4732 Transcript_2293/m.4732 type:complete len:211 (+) Transcript_2293:252-884(+)
MLPDSKQKLVRIRWTNRVGGSCVIAVRREQLPLLEHPSHIASGSSSSTPNARRLCWIEEAEIGRDRAEKSCTAPSYTLPHFRHVLTVAVLPKNLLCTAPLTFSLPPNRLKQLERAGRRRAASSCTSSWHFPSSMSAFTRGSGDSRRSGEKRSSAIILPISFNMHSSCLSVAPSFAPISPLSSACSTSRTSANKSRQKPSSLASVCMKALR